MIDVDTEYALRRDIKNIAIVREVDRVRVAEMWQWARVLALLGGVLVWSAWEHFQVLRYGYLIEDVRKQIVVEEERHRHLVLDRAVLLRPQRLEEIAIGQLGLVRPGPASTIVIERVKSDTPPQGVVASR
ncbi:MAG: hypothetical protein AB7I50_07890 [Vicinamibacterales bacterium]